MFCFDNERRKGEKGSKGGERGRETSQHAFIDERRTFTTVSVVDQSDAWVVRPPSRDRVIVVCLPGDVIDTKNYHRAYERPVLTPLGPRGCLAREVGGPDPGDGGSFPFRKEHRNTDESLEGCREIS